MMIRRMVPILFMFLLVFLMIGSAIAETGRATFTPKEDISIVLHNPDMGWVLYENYPLDQRPDGASTLVRLPKETFPDVDAVAIMFSWQDIERTKDVYDFSKVDYAYDYWKARGKQIQLRMSAESLLWWTGIGTGLGVPSYVLDALPAAKKQTRDCERIPYVVVDARDPYYRERLARFLKALATHFEKRPVTLVDLRGFGLWGEWHSGYKYPTVEDRVKALRKIVDIWTDNLAGHTLALSYSYDPDSPPEYYSGPTEVYSAKDAEHYKDFAHHSAFDYALTKPNIVFRRDGVGGCVHSNERRFIREAFDQHCKGTFVAEFCGGYSAAKKGGEKWVRFMIDDALNLHPNYINLLGWQTEDALSFCQERPDLIKLGLLNMGYRLVPVEVSVPSKIQSGNAFEFRSLWVNRAAGCAMVDLRLKLFLACPDSAKTVCELDLGRIGTSKWIKGKYYGVNKHLTLPNVPPGDYDLLLQLVDPRADQPIQLPLMDKTQSGGYRIGKVRVTGR